MITNLNQVCFPKMVGSELQQEVNTQLEPNTPP